MIGQSRFKEQIQELISNDKFPLFTIIVGRSGIGKKTACKYIAQLLGCDCVIWSNKIDDIRELKNIMENQSEEIIYCIPNYEDMSVGAKNSILKICEEPPRRAHIVLTSYSKDIIIPTILGRGTVFELGDYTEDELHQIAKDMIVQESQSTDNIIRLCEVPGDIETVSAMNVEEFINFMNVLWGNITKASAGNLLKVTNKIDTKNDGNGYNLDIFVNYLFRMVDSLDASRIKSRLYSQLMQSRRYIQMKYNKQYILDDLLLNIRGILNGSI